MLQKINLSHLLRSFALVIIVVFTFLLNFSYQTALAADNYSAPTDSYQETRNPNRVNTTTEELAKSKLNSSPETEGESIYDRLVDKVNQQQKKAENKQNKPKDRR